MAYSEGVYTFERDGSFWLARDASGKGLARFGRAHGAETRCYLADLTRWEGAGRSAGLASALIERLERSGGWVESSHWKALASAAGRSGEPVFAKPARKTALKTTAPKPTNDREERGAPKKKPARKLASKPSALLPPVSKATISAIDDVCTRIERFFVSLAERGLEVSPSRLAPASPEKIARFAATFSVAVPDDVQAFWRRGLRSGSVSFSSGRRSAFLGFDFTSVDSAGRSLKTLRSVALGDDEAEDDGPPPLQSIPISGSAPQLVVDTANGSISHFSVRNPWRGPVARSLRTFLESWLHAGCFSSHDAALAFEELARLGVRLPRATSKNPWLRYYDAQFPQLRSR